MYFGTVTGTPLTPPTAPRGGGQYETTRVDGGLSSAYERMLAECAVLEHQVRHAPSVNPLLSPLLNPLSPLLNTLSPVLNLLRSTPCWSARSATPPQCTPSSAPSSTPSAPFSTFSGVRRVGAP
eukprot:1177303-Prorocentrum_minimum.AAC.1